MLYTEMVTAQAVIHGDLVRLLQHAGDGPVALQLGGSEPRDLAQAVALAAPFGYDEVNLNCGCPSDRVQSGCFGAVLMETPDRVADCLRAMQGATDRPVSVKCRIGVDDQDPETALPRFLQAVAGAGVRHVIVHARKAWLKGLSPKENREIPPLDHALVLRMKREFPDLSLSINGGITSLTQARALMAQGIDGVMIGRVAYHDPGAVLCGADAFWSDPHAPDVFEVAAAMRPVIAAHLAGGGRLHQISRHMLGLFTGRPGARGWRRMLSEGAATGGLALYDRALACVHAAGHRLSA